MEISFLYNRVIEPDVENYHKLARVIKYIHGTIGLKLIISMEKSGNIKGYVDAACVVRKEMRRHTGGFMTTGNSGA